MSVMLSLSEGLKEKLWYVLFLFVFIWQSMENTGVMNATSLEL